MYNRVVLGQGLRVGYPNLPTLTKRYQTFLKEYVLSDVRLSAGALDIIQPVLETQGIDQRDVERELQCFLHNASKELHYLRISRPKGLYCGGQPVTLAAVATLVSLMQRQSWLLDDVDIVGPSGKTVLSAAGSVLRTV